MRIVITGATGNVGTSLLLRLGASGEHELVAVSRRRPPDVAPYDWADWQRIDVGNPSATDDLTAAFDGADAVVHLAWLIQPSRQRDVMRRTNQGGTRAVTDAVIAAGVPHFVHQSSVGAYGPGPKERVNESWPATGVPSSPYGVDKAAAEAIVSRAEAHTSVARMRPGLIFQDAAAGEVARYFLGPFVPTHLLGRRLLRLAPFSDALSFQLVHADDVATAIELVLANKASGAFNVAAEPVIDRTAFEGIFGGAGPALPVRALRAAAAATWHARLQPTEPGWVDLASRTPLMDTTRIRQLGWIPTHDAADVLGRFVDAIQRGAGRPGPLLYRRRPGRPGPTA
ncbi:MAG: NAD-dependent epimerase/dehydratase family protein [Jatrophihabitans sp.]